VVRKKVSMRLDFEGEFGTLFIDAGDSSAWFFTDNPRSSWYDQELESWVLSDGESVTELIPPIAKGIQLTKGGETISVDDVALLVDGFYTIWSVSWSKFRNSL